MEFNGFSFCKEQEESGPADESPCEEQERARALEIHRFSEQEEALKGMSFGKRQDATEEYIERPMPRVRIIYWGRS